MRSRRILSAACLLASSLGGLACSELGDVERGVCGNHIVEQGEACDAARGSDPLCGLPDGAYPCQYPVAQDHVCPIGFEGESSDGRCRGPSGAFDAPFSPMPTLLGRRPQVADHDGDGQLDVMVDSLDGLRSTPFFLDRREGELVPSPGHSTAGFAAWIDLTGDGVVDVASPEPEGLAVHRGTEDREGSLRIYTKRLPGEGRLVWLGDSQLTGYVLSDTARVLHSGPSDTCGGLACSCQLEAASCVEDFPFDVDSLAPISREQFLSLDTEHRGHSFAAITAIAMPEGQQIVVSIEEVGVGAPVRALELPTGRYVGGLVVRDLDGDRTADLGYVRSTPDCSALRAEIVPGTFEGFPSPLEPTTYLDTEGFGIGAFECPVRLGGPAFAFMTDDPWPEWVMSGARSWISLQCTAGDGVGRYSCGGLTSDGWTRHAVGDLNGDGLDDVVAAFETATAQGRSHGLEIVLGDDASFLSSVRVPTTAPVSHLVLGDVDGDRMDDVVAVVDAPGDDCAAEDEILVAYGRATTYPEPPLLLGRLAGVTQLTAGWLNPRHGDSDAPVDVGVTATCEGPGGELEHHAAVIQGQGQRRPYAPLRRTSAPRRVFPGAIVDPLDPGSFSGLILEEWSLLGEHQASVLPFGGDAELDESVALTIPLPLVDPGQRLAPQATQAARHVPGVFVLGSVVVDAERTEGLANVQITAYATSGKEVQALASVDLGAFTTAGCPLAEQTCFAGACLVPCSDEEPCDGTSGCYEVEADDGEVGSFCTSIFGSEPPSCGNDASRWSFATLSAPAGALLAVVATSVPFTESAPASTPLSTLTLVPWHEDGTFGEAVTIALPSGSSEFVDVVAFEGESLQPELLVATDAGVFRFDASGALVPVTAGVGATAPPLTGVGISGLARGDFTQDGLDDLLVLDERGGRVVPQAPALEEAVEQ